MKKLVVGILAHVDAGKTTLSEGILYESGQLRTLGRVDHGDAFLDNYSLERERGITIFSKQAVFRMGELQCTLLDTPGHVDFSAEMERTLQVLDYAILVINGADGVQSHTETLWQLLARYRIPTFLFINKMDQPGTDRAVLMEELKRRLDANCVDFTAADSPGEGAAGEQSAPEHADAYEALLENIAMCDEALLEQYLESGQVEETAIAELLAQRKLFPCCFGSALKLQGVRAFLRLIQKYARVPAYDSAFSARVFKITRDAQGNRLTHMKITGGSLKVRTRLSETEKVNQIRIYSGEKYESVEVAEAGSICAVTGLSATAAGQGLGAASEAEKPLLQPVLNYRILPPEGCDIHTLYGQLKQLEEESPELHIVWDSGLNELHAHLMGEVQTEILKQLIAERFQLEIAFGTGKILYLETIADSVEGVGHFEPLRHYAEVHLLLEPGERGSGLRFAADCSEDMLDKNWQRLVLTHLAEKEHIGVLTGSPVTDLRVTLVAGRAHLKHTEGGDFRQATYRALRQGLRKAQSVLLEPVYEFTLELPGEMLGRAMTDIQKMHGSFAPPEQSGEFARITGEAPVVNMRAYQQEVLAYTKGRGRLFCRLKGYAPCHNAEEVIAAYAYDPEADVENPTGSVFCAHGAGFNVPYNEVEQYMHVESGLRLSAAADEMEADTGGVSGAAQAADESWREGGRFIGDKELEEIFVRTYGPIKERAFAPQPKGKSRSWNGAALKTAVSPEEHAQTGENAAQQSGRHCEKHRTVQRTKLPEYLLVDGYNIIFAWDDLKELAQENLDAARGKLLDILSNYQGFTQKKVIAVFDAYRVQGHACEELMYHNIFVVYTREAQTADQYIERLVHEIGRKYQVTVATSDHLEQIIIWGQGGTLLSARGLKEEIERVNTQIRTEHLAQQQYEKSRLADYLPSQEGNPEQ